MRRAFSLASLVVASIGACSEPYRRSDDLPDAGTPEAGATVDASDATAETSPLDASTAVDAACDATFCDDFDTPPLGAGWTGKSEVLGALSLVEGGLSQPFALRAAVDEDDGGRGRSAYLYRRFSMTTSIDCATAIRPVAIPVAAYVVQLLGGSAAVSEWGALLSVAGNATTLTTTTKTDGGVSRVDAPNAPPLPSTAWSQVELHVDSNEARLSIDGVELSIAPFGAPLGASVVDVKIGAIAYDARAHSVNIDDVRCTVR